MKKILLIIYIGLGMCGLIQSQTNPCLNTNFESTTPGTFTTANGVNGWTVSSQISSTATGCNTSTVWTSGSAEFSIVATPITGIPGIGTLGGSPLGGSIVAQLNNYTSNNQITRLVKTYSVGSGNSILQYAFAFAMEDGSHQCCEQSSFKILLKDCGGSLLTCYSLTAPASGSYCSFPGSYSVSNGMSWSNWQVKLIDLTPWIGSCVTIEVISSDCIFGDDFGTMFFDAQCSTPILIGSGIPVDNYFSYNFVNNCAGSPFATIQGPPGYIGYQWYGPGSGPSNPGPLIPAFYGGNQNVVTIYNPSLGSVYTVYLTTPSGCVFVATYTISYSQVNIAGLGSIGSCIGGSSGSATVVANGSGQGYNYSWINSTNSVIATSSVVNNLANGVYSVMVTSLGSAGCGTAISTVTISTATPTFYTLTKPYCSSQPAIVTAPVGSNYKWFDSTLTLLTGTITNISSYTVTTPVNNSYMYVSFLSTQGCQDSIKFKLVSSPSGSLTIPPTGIKIICPAATNGTASIVMMPVLNSQSGSNSFSVNSTGTTSTFSSSLYPTTSNAFTVGGLSAGTYSVKAFDGSCSYTSAFSVIPYTFNYTISPYSPTICAGQSIPAAISFSTLPSPAQYTYSWSPTMWLVGGVGSYSFTLITPSIAPGTSTTIIYTVVVTPTVANCPLTKTISVSAIHLLTPTITPILPLCNNDLPVTITVNPSGGLFINNPGIPYGPNGILTPSLALTGNNTFTYILTSYTCSSQSTGTFLVNNAPQLNVSGNKNLCIGQTTTLNATGADSQIWSNGSPGSSVVLTPLVTTTLSVTGTNTNGCSATTLVSVQVAAVPIVNITGNNAICSGKSATLTASGANTYSWSNNVTGNTNVVSPNISTNYYVTGFNSSVCKDSASVLINVTPTPTVIVSGNFSICTGESTLLKATGAGSYLWSNNATSAIIGVAPLNTVAYVVTGSNGICSDTKTVTVTVDECSGIYEPALAGNIKIYPNPVKHDLVIESSGAVEVALYNQLGMLLLNKNLEKGKNSLNLSELSSGIYFIKATDQQKTTVVRIVKTE